jgi:hypothetical protein
MFEIQSTQARGGPQPVPFVSSRRAGVVRQGLAVQADEHVGDADLPPVWAIGARRYRRGVDLAKINRLRRVLPAARSWRASWSRAATNSPSGSRYSAATAASTSTASPGILLAAPYQTGCHTRGEAAVTGSHSP